VGKGLCDPTDGVSVFEKRLDEQHIRMVFSNKLIRLREDMCGTTNMIPSVAANNRD
jgi:hypothetical protein